MYDFLEYRYNYSVTSEGLCGYYRYKMNINEDNAGNYTISNNQTTANRSFEYKAKITESKPADYNTLDTQVVFLLKYLSNVSRCLDLSFINCKIELNLRWIRFCITSKILGTAQAVDGVAAKLTTSSIF